MTSRRTPALVVLGLSLPLAVARADTGAGVGTDITGVIASSTEGIDDGATLSIREHVTGKCSYVGITTTDGRIIFAFGGSAESYSRSASQPQATQVNCRFVSPNQPGVPGSEPTYEKAASTALAGAAAAAGAVTDSLQLRPVFVCVSAFGVFGPIPPAQNPRFLGEICGKCPPYIQIPCRSTPVVLPR